jgi:hypothetical protein
LWDIQNSIDVFMVGWSILNLGPILYNNNLHIYPSLHWLFMEDHCLWKIIVYGRSLFMDGYSIKNFSVIFNSFPISKIIFKIEKKYISLKEHWSFFVEHPEFYRRFYGRLINIEPWTNQLSITIITSISQQTFSKRFQIQKSYCTAHGVPGYP